MTYQFKFKTSYTFDKGLHDGPDQRDGTEYVAHLVDGNYRIVVEQGNFEAYTEMSLQSVFNKVMSGEWQVIRK